MLCRMLIAAIVAVTAGVPVSAHDMENGVVGWPTHHRATLSGRVDSRNDLVRLPPLETTPPVALPGPVVQGTYREEGNYLVLNLDGREIRLSRENDNAARRAAATGPAHQRSGAVQGRLVHRGVALANCRVALIPMVKTFSGSYRLHRSGPRWVATTDEHGDYYFETVPAGAYKLTWLREGGNQWIRRIAMRPDVVVRENETARAKETRTALTTVN
ncbi:MAG: carboxypeptidase-like regulatory domain-containing protein [Pirellulaceae bacterium]